jgi:hypothetical protein
MRRIFTASVVGLAFSLCTIPAFANEVTGPRGRSTTNNSVVKPNASGGYTGVGKSTINGVNGGSATVRRGFRTNGQGNAVYGGSGSITTPSGQTYNGTTSGSGSYNPTTGYSGNNTTTINDKTVNTNTSDRSTTITGPQGNSRTFSPSVRRR